jgi:hypothetical protein
MTRVCLYTRISTDEENQPTSLHSQRERLVAFCSSQEGWRIVAREEDRATGTKLDLPGLERALGFAEAGKTSTGSSRTDLPRPHPLARSDLRGPARAARRRGHVRSRAGSSARARRRHLPAPRQRERLSPLGRRSLRQVWARLTSE